MQGAPNQLEGFRRNRAHEGIPVTAGGNADLFWAFVKVVGAVPALIAVMWGVYSLGQAEGGFDDLRARFTLISMNQALGYEDPMRYLQIVGSWVAIALSFIVLWMMISKAFGEGSATLKKANGSAEQAERNRRMGLHG